MMFGSSERKDVQIQKFDGRQFSLWKAQIKAWFDVENLLDCLTTQPTISENDTAVKA